MAEGKLPIPRLKTASWRSKTTKEKISPEGKRERKKEIDRARDKTRINLGSAFARWRDLRDSKGFKLDSKFALFLLDGQCRRDDRVCSADFEKDDSVSPGNAADPKTVSLEKNTTPRVQQLATDRLKAADGAHQWPRSWDEWTASRRSENQEHGHVEDEDFYPSLSVGDGRYLLDLGSSSEFIVDEESLFQLFRTCQKCDERCRVRKRVKGLKITLSQVCGSCENHFKWTNLPDGDDSSGESE